MSKYKVVNLDAGLLSGGFEDYGSKVPVFKSLVDLFMNAGEYSKNPEDFIKNNPDFVFSGRITKVVTDRVIRPFVIVSDKLEYMDKKKLSDIIKFNIDLFTAYFLQAIKILANVYNVDVTMIARQVTDKTLIKSTARAIKLSKNVVGKILPGVEDNSKDLIKKYAEDIHYGLLDDSEVSEEEPDSDADNTVTEEDNVVPIKTEITFKDAEKDLKVTDNFLKIVNLDLQVTVGKGREKETMKVAIPFVIAPIVRYTNSDTFIRNAIGIDNEETFEARWLKFRGGEIGLWDLVFAGDLINDYKRNKIKNGNDVAELLRKKNLKNIGGNIMTAEGGFTTYTNMYIFDKSDEMMIEDILQEDLIEPEVWQDLALKLLAFDVNFVDVDKENITNFITDMPTYSVLGFRDIKKKTKDSDDVTELLKAMLVNKPVF